MFSDPLDFSFVRIDAPGPDDSFIRAHIYSFKPPRQGPTQSAYLLLNRENQEANLLQQIEKQFKQSFDLEDKGTNE